MTRKMVVILGAFFCLAVATAVAQSKDFSGTWAVDPDKSTKGTHAPPTIKITMTAKTISIEPLKMKPLTFNLDGTETDLEGGKGKAEWKGNKLVVTLTPPAGATRSMTWSREGDLLLHEMETSHGFEKSYFKRQPPAK